jgi:hypothetical protein
MNVPRQGAGMTVKKTLAAAIMAGLTLGALGVATPASAADGVLPPNKVCPNSLSEWTFYTGRYNDVAYKLTIFGELGRQCTYTAKTEVITADGAADEIRTNARVTITKGFIYPIVIL